jgi:hypothetical protein
METRMGDWTVLFNDACATERPSLPEAVQDELLAYAELLERFGPSLGRPTVEGSRDAKRRSGMKGLDDIINALPARRRAKI